jgi:hypothetical protein
MAKFAFELRERVFLPNRTEVQAVVSGQFRDARGNSYRLEYTEADTSGGMVWAKEADLLAANPKSRSQGRR